MTFEQALTELGLTRASSADEARRAYLRLIKDRKPEADPAGFQRARGAWECVKAQLANAASLAAELGGAPAQPDRPVSPGGESLDEFRRELSVAGASPAALLEIAGRAVDALPGEREVWLWLSRANEAAGNRAEAAAVLRRGRARFPDLLAEEIRLAPDAFDAEELARIADGRSCLEVLALAKLFAAQSHPRAGVELTVAVHRQNDAPSSDEVFKLALICHELGEPEASRRLCERHNAWLQEHGQTEVLRRSWLDSGWRRLDELNRLGPGFSGYVRMMLAHAMRTGLSLQWSLDGFEAFREALPDEAARAAEELHEQPLLRETYRAVLEVLKPLPPRTLHWYERVTPGAMGCGAVALAVIALALSQCLGR